ncbi:cullin [Acrasis kona]|uniref:Cullin n=1 Tax=Acrasis kona TaxID=1008807 RepID=A0AAW2ZCS1_9EUKA
MESIRGMMAGLPRNETNLSRSILQVDNYPRCLAKGTNDICHKAVVGEQTIKLLLIGPDNCAFDGKFNYAHNIRVVVKGPGFDTLASIKISEESELYISFMATKAGSYNINTWIFEDITRESPVRFALEAGPVEMPNCIIKCAQFERDDSRVVPVFNQILIHVELQDKYHNPIESFTDFQSFYITENNAPASALSYRMERNCLVIVYTPTNIGIIDVRLFYKNQNITKKGGNCIRLYCVSPSILSKCLSMHKSARYKFTASIIEGNKSSKYTFSVKKSAFKVKDVFMIFFKTLLQSHFIGDLKIKHTPEQTKNILIVHNVAHNASFQIKFDTLDGMMLAAVAIRSEKRKSIRSDQQFDHLINGLLIPSISQKTSYNTNRIFRIIARSGGRGKIVKSLRAYTNQQALLCVSNLEQSCMNSFNLGVLLEFRNLINTIERLDESELFKNSTNLRNSLNLVLNSKIVVNSVDKLVLHHIIDMVDNITKQNQIDTSSVLDDLIDVLVMGGDLDLVQGHLQKRLCDRLTRHDCDENSLMEERSLLIKLKIKINSSFTRRMECMLKDINHSLELSDGSKVFRPLVLTSSNWPIVLNTPYNQIIIPKSLNENISQFEALFKSRMGSGRKLSWDHYSSFATVTARYKSATYQLSHVDIRMLCILYLFNDNDKLNVKYIMAELGLNTEQEVTNVLDRVSKEKMPFFVVDENNNYCVNQDFSMKHRKIKLVDKSSKPLPIQNKVTSEVVDRDRGFIIEACCVRIMKARKVLTHNELIQQVTQQVSLFVPDVKMIKNRIEALIEKEYIEREEKDLNIYKYCA